MKIMKANKVSASPAIKVALTGPSGSGKTAWLARCPNPLLLMFESQGVATVRSVNPEAPVVLIESYEQFREVWNEIKMAAKHPDVPGAIQLTMGDETIAVSTICIDSFTDLGNRMMDTLISKRGGRSYSAANFSMDTIQLPIQEWGRIGDALKEILREIRDFPISVVCSFLPYESEDPAGNTWRYPSVPGKSTMPKILSYFNAAGFARRRNRGHGVEHWIVWSHPSERYPVKPMFGWPMQTQNTMTPGQTTLGSLLMKTYPDSDCTVMPGDDAEYCESVDDTVEDGYTAPAPVNPPDAGVVTVSASGMEESERKSKKSLAGF